MDKKFQKSFMKCFMGTAGDFFLAGSQKDRHRGTSALWAKLGDQVVVSLKTKNKKIHFILLFSGTLETNNEPS